MKYSHNQICTKDDEIEVGKQYCYKEGFPTVIAEVIILEDNSNDEFIAFKVKVIKAFDDFPKAGEEFDISARRGKYAYSGMWRLWDSGTYRDR